MPHRHFPTHRRRFLETDVQPRIIESRLQSKRSAVPDYGGEDRIVVTGAFAAVIDGATAKTGSRYCWQGGRAKPGEIAADIIRNAIPRLEPEMEGLEACQFLNAEIYGAYEDYGIVDKAKENPAERFEASVVLYNAKKNYIAFAGNCQAIVGGRHYQTEKQVDVLNAAARAAEIRRLLDSGDLTLEALAAMPLDQEPGRKLIQGKAPAGAGYPGLTGQADHQNNPHSPFGFFALDGFADFSVNGFRIIDVPLGTEEIVLASDGYPVGKDPADSLCTLKNAEQNLADMLLLDPLCFSLNPCTKGKHALDNAADDRAYLRMLSRKPSAP